MGPDSLLTDRVTIVITCYNQARFLPDAIDSALAQTYPLLEILVIDDGSTDHTSGVATRYPGIRYIRSRHAGLATARNLGITESTGEYLVFLDADDRLLPQAVDAGITFFRAHPDCAFVFGHHRLVAIDGSRLAEWRQPDVGGDHYLALLRRNHIAMHATVMYRRTTFDRIGGFDPSLRACEDYELYLRIARTLPVGCYETIIAEYRQHNTNMSRNYGLMLSSALMAHRTHWKYAKGRTPYAEAHEEGRRFWQTFYGEPLVAQVQTQLQTSGQRRKALNGLFVLLLYYPRGLSAACRYLTLEVRGLAQLPKLAKTLARRIGRRLAPKRARQLWRAWRASSPRPMRHRVRFGSLRRLSPISRTFGFDRGQPIDRFYIEHFLAKHAADVQGQVLEIGDNAYTLRFGDSRVTRSDVLHVVEGNPGATIVADLTRAAQIPAGTFDCIIFTQTLHLIYDVRAAIETLYRILKPGGVVLATFPGTSQVSQDEWRAYWCWSFTVLSARRLFEEHFSADLHVEAYGNVLTSVAFLHGLAAEELRQEELQHHDPQYQLLIAVRAQKRAPSA